MSARLDALIYQMLNKNLCSSCAYRDHQTGRCHRHAPRPSTPNELAATPGPPGEEWWDYDWAIWPVVEDSDWCGEHKRLSDDEINAAIHRLSEDDR